MKRNVTLDIAKGIGILLVIISHCALFNDVRLDLFSFHMPLFFIISGYFFSDKPFAAFMRVNVRKLLVPYLITSVLIGCYLYLADVRSLGRIIIDLLYAHGGPKHTLLLPTETWIGATWFLMALFWCRIYFWLIHKLLHRNESRLLWSVAVAYVSYRLGAEYINLPFGLLLGGNALGFYAIGYCMRSHKLSPEVTYMLIILWMCSLHFKFYGLDMVNFIYKYFPLNLLTAWGGSMLVIKASAILADVRLDQRFSPVAAPVCRVLAFIGRNTLYIYCIHCLCIKILPNYILEQWCYFGVNLAIPMMLLLAYKLYTKYKTSKCN